MVDSKVFFKTLILFATSPKQKKRKNGLKWELIGIELENWLMEDWSSLWWFFIKYFSIWFKKQKSIIKKKKKPFMTFSRALNLISIPFVTLDSIYHFLAYCERALWFCDGRDWWLKNSQNYYQNIKNHLFNPIYSFFCICFLFIFWKYMTKFGLEMKEEKEIDEGVFWLDYEKNEKFISFFFFFFQKTFLSNFPITFSKWSILK